MKCWVAVAALFVLPVPAAASSYAQVKKVCPVGGEKFTATELMAISTWGGLPDGMPLGSGMFPVALTECPGNGLLMYRDFTAADVVKLKPLVADPAYQVMRKMETSYYRAWWLADRLGDADALWLLLSATWQAKNQDDAAMSRRYGEQFVALVGKIAASDKDFTSIALRARAANAVRELGRFDEAEALRASITVAEDAGGSDPEAVDNRKGWRGYLTSLAAVILRRDVSRTPIDMLDDRSAAARCVEPERPKEAGYSPMPLTPFETGYCKRPDLAEMIATLRKGMAEMQDMKP